MSRSGCSALHGVNLNLKKKKKKNSAKLQHTAILWGSLVKFYMNQHIKHTHTFEVETF